MDLADFLEITFQQIQKYEQGANRNSASKLVRIAEHLDMTVTALVGEGAADMRGQPLEAAANPSADELVDCFRRIADPELGAAIFNLMRRL
jgi:transcriptional regulator with XRE-family HTH domain